jgi:hypothetical protein
MNIVREMAADIRGNYMAGRLTFGDARWQLHALGYLLRDADALLRNGG